MPRRPSMRRSWVRGGGRHRVLQLVLVAGSIRAKPICAALWTCDSRLTTTLILWLLYCGDPMRRATADDSAAIGRGGRDRRRDQRAGVIVAVRLWRRFIPWVLVTRRTSCEGRPSVIGSAAMIRGAWSPDAYAAVRLARTLALTEDAAQA